MAQLTSADTDSLRARYAEERAKRLRPDGNDQYLEVKDSLGHYLEDPYTERADRQPLADHVTVAVIGGGFAGLLTGARLREAGVESIRMIEKAGEFGGTWYWNRYPGAQCDTAALIYMPLLEETGHIPSERYVHAPEILEHCERIGKQFGLYDDALFHTKVDELEWDDHRSRWIVRTDRGDVFTADFVAIGTGPLHVPKLPGIEGIESFEGHSFHTSRWDYAYTGGDPAGAPLDKLVDKKVAIVGTGATAVQCIPHLASTCKELYVFQRTPSSVDVRGNAPIDPDWFGGIADSGWQNRWLENFVANMTIFEAPEEDLVNDGWTDLSKRIRGRMSSPDPNDGEFPDLMNEFEFADFAKMSEIRARVDSIVSDPVTAEHLKAWYRQLCKRPCFHDEYLDSYNLPSVHLVDTDGKGVDRITNAGVEAGGVEYTVDCIIYASGFEVGTPATRRYGFDVIGRDGIRLSEYWAEGMQSMFGVFVRGFPNAFVMQVSQGANFLANVPHNLADSARTVAAAVAHATATGSSRVEVSEQAQDAWMAQLTPSPVITSFLSECTPGYYNNEGKVLEGRNTFLFTGYPLGPAAYFRFSDEWRNSDNFAGLEFAPSARTVPQRQDEPPAT